MRRRLLFNLTNAYRFHLEITKTISSTEWRRTSKRFVERYNTFGLHFISFHLWRPDEHTTITQPKINTNLCTNTYGDYFYLRIYLFIHFPQWFCGIFSMTISFAFLFRFDCDDSNNDIQNNNNLILIAFSTHKN